VVHRLVHAEQEEDDLTPFGEVLAAAVDLDLDVVYDVNIEDGEIGGGSSGSRWGLGMERELGGEGIGESLEVEGIKAERILLDRSWRRSWSTGEGWHGGVGIIVEVCRHL
jgi:hypothetical protein